MSQRNYYRTATGFSTARAAAVLVSPHDLVEAVHAHYASIPPPAAWSGQNHLVPVDDRFFVGVAEHETNFATNEVDVENDTTPPGFTSKGLFQISDGFHFDDGAYHVDEDEVGQAIGACVDLLDLASAVLVFAKMAENFRLVVCSAAGISTVIQPPDDVLAYMGIMHNEGGKAVRKTIAEHGLDWAAYKRRNGACALHRATRSAWEHPCDPASPCTPYVHHIGRYGDACITGGSRYAEVDR